MPAAPATNAALRRDTLKACNRPINVSSMKWKLPLKHGSAALPYTTVHIVVRISITSLEPASHRDKATHNRTGVPRSLVGSAWEMVLIDEEIRVQLNRSNDPQADNGNYHRLAD